jgi:hypothetical protein
LNSDDVSKVISGSFDVRSIPDGKHKGIVLMGAHCCLNGPVGTNKPTTFPLIEGLVSISSHMGFRVSNSSWRAFCRDLAILLNRDYPDECMASQQVRLAGGLWPLSPSISEVRK